jgi:predicted nucleic-acid-binding protein
VNIASVDTNVLLRATLVQDDRQSEAAIELLTTPNMVFHVSDTAIIEYVFVLAHHYGFGRAVIADMVHGLETIESLSWHREQACAAVDFFANRPKLSFEDCLMAEQARALDALPLYTFDKKLAAQHDAAELVAVPVAD